MTSISSIQTVTTLASSNISSILTTNNGGVEMTFNVNDPISVASLQNSFLSLSTVTTIDLSGASTLYMVDIPGAENQSTLSGMSTLQSISTAQAVSTLEGVSTFQGMSSLAAIEVDINDIFNSHHTLIQIERQNKEMFASLDFSQFKNTLYKWAALNYPDSFLAYSFPVTTPPMTNCIYCCSDGNPKNIWDYIPYCLGMSIQDWLTSYQSKVSGITLSFSVNANPYVLNIHVSRSV
jgi:hypothetical protein